MTYQSVDQLQKVLATTVFHYTQDAKKASGRSLGTLVEIIIFYLLKSWGLENSVTIEKPLREYGNPDITHNVEYSLHPILKSHLVSLPEKLPITPTRLIAAIDQNAFQIEKFVKTSNILLASNLILRNSCVIATKQKPYPSHIIANLLSKSSTIQVAILEQYAKPYAMIECKRVGIEEGMRKGPQTIEKAKQGAYVAKTVSSLHKIRIPSGELHGLVYKPNGEIYTKPYADLLTEIVTSHNPGLLKDFILTIGVVSNHGNWFTSNNQNKELKVLAQAYDWLLFLTDEGLSEFITELLLEPSDSLLPIKNSFLTSYTPEKKKNSFTKVQIDYEADQLLQSYFRANLNRIEKWFNIITPKNSALQSLHTQISELQGKNWHSIHSL